MKQLTKKYKKRKENMVAYKNITGNNTRNENSCLDLRCLEIF